MRIIADHMRAAIFMIADGALPSNKAQGYFTRRFIRRAVIKGHQLGIESNFLKHVSKTVCSVYEAARLPYELIADALDKEETRFRKTLADGLNDIDSLKAILMPVVKNNDGRDIIPSSCVITDRIVDCFFDLYQSKGMPLELVFEALDSDNIVYDKKTIQTKFQEKFKAAPEQSRTSSVGMFRGGWLMRVLKPRCCIQQRT